jgi:hypothetical protein
MGKILYRSTTSSGGFSSPERVADQGRAVRKFEAVEVIPLSTEKKHGARRGYG